MLFVSVVVCCLFLLLFVCSLFVAVFVFVNAVFCVIVDFVVCFLFHLKRLRMLFRCAVADCGRRNRWLRRPANVSCWSLPRNEKEYHSGGECFCVFVLFGCILENVVVCFVLVVY